MTNSSHQLWQKMHCLDQISLHSKKDNPLAIIRLIYCPFNKAGLLPPKPPRKEGATKAFNLRANLDPIKSSLLIQINFSMYLDKYPLSLGGIVLQQLRNPKTSRRHVCCITSSLPPFTHFPSATKYFISKQIMTLLATFYDFVYVHNSFQPCFRFTAFLCDPVTTQLKLRANNGGTLGTLSPASARIWKLVYHIWIQIENWFWTPIGS